MNRSRSAGDTTNSESATCNSLRAKKRSNPIVQPVYRLFLDGRILDADRDREASQEIERNLKAKSTSFEFGVGWRTVVDVRQQFAGFLRICEWVGKELAEEVGGGHQPPTACLLAHWRAFQARWCVPPTKFPCVSSRRTVTGSINAERCKIPQAAAEVSTAPGRPLSTHAVTVVAAHHLPGQPAAEARPSPRPSWPLPVHLDEI
jgi:hypothetical protein